MELERNVIFVLRFRGSLVVGPTSFSASTD
jgi:hypothetical protein